MTQIQEIRQQLERALEQLLTALTLAGWDLEGDVPDGAIDAALSEDPGVREARSQFRQALNRVEHLETRMCIEEKGNALIVKVVDLGFRLGFRVGRGFHRK